MKTRMLSAVSQVENVSVGRGDAFTTCGIKTPDIASCHRGLEPNPAPIRRGEGYKLDRSTVCGRNLLTVKQQW